MSGTRPVLDPEATRRLLVVRLDNLGDVVLLTPALRALRRALPRAAITLLASPAGATLAPLLPWVDEVVAVRALWQDANGALPFAPAREQALIRRLAAAGYDAAVISTSFSQTPHAAAYACYLAGIPLRAAISTDFGGGVLTSAVAPPADGTHQAERALALVAGIGVPSADAHLALAAPPEPAVLRTLDVQAPYAVVAPGASCPSRRYDAARFAAVAAGLTGDAGLPVVVVGSERERDLAAVVAEGAGVSSIAGATTVPELAGVIAGAAVLVTNNSGPMHLADAYGTPVVALFAGTEREREYAPRSAPLRLLRRPTVCSPCRAFACPYQLECLDLAPGDVVAAAFDLLSEHDHGPRPHLPQRAGPEEFTPCAS